MQCKVYFFMFFNGEEKCKAPRRNRKATQMRMEKMYANGLRGFT